jgi:hypothetical protein
VPAVIVTGRVDTEPTALPAERVVVIGGVELKVSTIGSRGSAYLNTSCSAAHPVSWASVLPGGAVTAQRRP